MTAPGDILNGCRNTLWKRNLVQLNRLPLSSISLQDRIRFFQEYSAAERAADLNRRITEWLEQKTRERRRECDSVDATISFRQIDELGKTKH